MAQGSTPLVFLGKDFDSALRPASMKEDILTLQLHALEPPLRPGASMLTYGTLTALFQ